MALFGRGMSLKVSTPAHDRENLDPGTRSIKHGLASSRKHLAPKQAFGELKNTFHNQQFMTPVKGNIKQEKPINSKSVASVEKPPILKPRKDANAPKDHYKMNLEYIWSEKVVLRDDEINNIINAKDSPRKKKVVQKSKFDILMNDFNIETKMRKKLERSPRKDLVPALPMDDWDML